MPRDRVLSFKGVVVRITPKEQVVYFDLEVLDSRFKGFIGESFQCTVFPSRNRNLFFEFLESKILKGSVIDVRGHFEDKKGGGMHLIVHKEDKIAAMLEELPEESNEPVETPSEF